MIVNLVALEPGSAWAPYALPGPDGIGWRLGDGILALS